MDIFDWLKLAGIVLTFVLGTAVPFIIALVNSHKKKKAATTEAEKVAAENDMIEALKGFIVKAEEDFEAFNAFMKKQGLTGGVTKKESVMSKALAYAIEKGYKFDAEFISAKIDDIVAMTRKVNSK